ncbi:MAG: hypothetical protein ABR535_05280, partial [Pyrinomonadaceae bacterium]
VNKRAVARSRSKVKSITGYPLRFRQGLLAMGRNRHAESKNNRRKKNYSQSHFQFHLATTSPLNRNARAKK